MRYFIKTILLIFGFILYSFFGFSQNDKNDEDTIYVYTEQMPEYPGGIIGLKRHIAENLIYPKDAREQNIQGTVFLRFEVTKTGEIGKVEIQKGAHSILDSEAIRVIKSLPKFKPGMKDGKPVNIWYSMPITFQLNSSQNEITIKPKYPEGDAALLQYVYSHFIIPDNLHDPDIYGVIKVKCELNKSGNVTNAEIIKSVHPLLDKEAKRVVKTLPKFVPGTINGKPVKSYIIIPVTVIEPIFNSKDNKPEFLNYNKSVSEYIKENINYPKEALYAGIKGIVYVKFELTKNGMIDNISDINHSNINHSNLLLSKEAVRIIKSLPDLKPEKINHKPANVWYTVPVIFNNEKIKIELAEYYGADSLLYKLINEKVTKQLKEKPDSGSLSVIFEVKKNGKIGETKIVESCNSYVDSVILGIISSLPDFKPGKVNGKVADTWYYLSFTDKIFIYVRNMPEFPGGVMALKRYIAVHVDYPREAVGKGIQGIVFLRFEVTKTGDIGKVEIQKGVHPLLDNAAIKVIKSLPKFKPGEQNGKKVNVWYSLPVTFKLN